MSSSCSPSPSCDVGSMRCIAHLDMDCFYAQVEAVRLGVDCRTTPFVCVQWGSFIAVNYPARAMGVRRFRQTPAEVQREHPELRMGHIATYAVGELEYGYPAAPRIQTHKVSLEPYRHASRQIFAILRSEPGVTVGKAGIDEAYIDVTEAAQRELAGLRAAAGDGAVLDPLADVLAPSTRLIADRRAEMQAWCAQRGTSLAAVFDEPMAALLRGAAGRAVEGSRGFCVDAADAGYAARCLLLCAASRVVLRLRQRIYAELHYDCSAGIAHNRVLAKCISATHKPNQQTLLLPDRSASALFDLPLTEIRGFGGKFGAAVSAVCGGATDCRELWCFPMSQFASLSDADVAVDDDEDGDGGGAGEEDDGGKKKKNTTGRREGASKQDDKGTQQTPHSAVAEYVFYRIRGVHGDRVADPALPRSMDASKIFHPSCTSWPAARLWMAPLAGELWHRFRHYESCYLKEGRSLVVYVRTYVDANDTRRGIRSQSYRRSTALPSVITGAAMLAETGLRELERLMRDVTQVDLKAPPLSFLPPEAETPASSSATAAVAATATATVNTAVDKEEGEGQTREMTESSERGAAQPAPTSAATRDSVSRTALDGIDEASNMMPPLRIIGLSIIGLRLHPPQTNHPSSSNGGGGDGEGDGLAAAVELPQRSLRDMFAVLSASKNGSATPSSAAVADTAATVSPSRTKTETVGSSGNDPSGEMVATALKRSREETSDASSAVEIVDDDDDDGDDASARERGECDGQGATVCAGDDTQSRGDVVRVEEEGKGVCSRADIASFSSSASRGAHAMEPACAPASSPAKQRPKTIDDFFRKSQPAPSAPRNKAGAVVASGQRREAECVDVQQRTQRSASVIEISSGEDDPTA